jgi:hypothetical protein
MGLEIATNVSSAGRASRYFMAPSFQIFALPHLGIARRRRRGARLGFAGLPVTMPPHSELTTPAADDGNVDREHEKPERDHPEAEHRQEPKQTQGDEQDAEPDADRLRFRQMPMGVEDADSGGHANIERCQVRAGHRGLRPHAQLVATPQGLATLRASRAGSSGKGPALLLSKVSAPLSYEARSAPR